MALFRDTPIQRKLMTMILVTSGVVLLLTCAGFIGYELSTYRGTAIQQLRTLAEIIAAESTGAVAFDRSNCFQPVFDHPQLRAIVGLVWRTVVMWMVVLALLSLARLLG